MNVLKRRNRMKSQGAMQHGLDALLSHSSARWPEGGEEPLVVAEWTPLVDVSEDDKEYLIKAELSEVKKEDVKATAQEGTLTIMGERKFEPEEKGKRYHRVERAYGSFGRSFSLPVDANMGNVSAEFRDGVLTVHLVKDRRPSLNNSKSRLRDQLLMKGERGGNCSTGQIWGTATPGDTPNSIAHWHPVH